MRVFLALILLVCTGAASALDTARELASTGALGLALARVEELQPRDPAQPRWADWEALRIELLAGLGRHAEALRRADALPANMPRPLLRAALLAAARAGIAAGQAAAARRHAARVIWQLEPSTAETRAARLVVIDSYVAERQGDAAFGAMLRFQQDYAPLEGATATHFVEALLTLDLERHAVNWLAGLDDTSPIKLMLRLRAGLVANDSAIAQARAGLAKGGGAGYWRVLAEAAQRQKDSALRIDALEHLLDSDEKTGVREPAALAAELWETYLAGAQEAANRNHMLLGDDGAWSDFAARRLASSPQLSRAFFAHLAQRGRERDTRFNAQLQLVHSLQEARLERAALRLFATASGEEAALDAQARYLLGAMAERGNLPALAGQFWKGLPAPPGVSAEQWQARLAAVYWRGGMNEAAVSTLRGLLRPGTALPPDAVQLAMMIAREMAAIGQADHADEVLRALLPLTEPRVQRDVLFALGRMAESGARFQLAADYFLRSALLSTTKAPDAQAAQARLAAALNLSRAGYRDDARAQFQWLLKNATDPAQLEIARRELAKL